MDCQQEKGNRLHWTVRPIQPIFPFPVVILWPNWVVHSLFWKDRVEVDWSSLPSHPPCRTLQNSGRAFLEIHLTMMTPCCLRCLRPFRDMCHTRCCTSFVLLLPVAPNHPVTVAENFAICPTLPGALSGYTGSLLRHVVSDYPLLKAF